MPSFIENVWTEDGSTPNPSVSGVYTPELTETTNVDSSAVSLCTYCRVGQTVIVSGQVTLTAGEAGAVELGISLPVQSSLGAVAQLAGVGGSSDVAALSVGILGDADNDRASMQYVAADGSEHTIAFMFMYQQVI